MAAIDITKRIFAPTALVGKLYAVPYGGGTALTAVGNALEASVEYKEDVESQEDMTALGGGKHGEGKRDRQADPHHRATEQQQGKRQGRQRPQRRP